MCNIQFTEANSVNPFSNDTCGMYCSSWCFFSAALDGDTLECGHPACNNDIKLAHAVGLNWYARNCAELNLVHPDNSSYGHFSHLAQARFTLLHQKYTMRNVPSSFSVQPGPADRPAHIDSRDDWLKRLERTDISVHLKSHLNKNVRNALICANMVGNLQPAQLDVMPRVYFNIINDKTPSFEKRTVFCSRACRDAPPTCKRTGVVKCLNPICPNVFETAFSAGTFECLRAVFVKANGERVLKGYVCDTYCMDRYGQAMIHMSSRKRRLSTPSTSPAKRQKIM